MNSKLKLNTLLCSTLILLALLLRVGCALAFPNIFWADEIFQTQEPAHRLAFGHGIITWEYRDGIRSWIFPALLAAIMRLTAWLGDGSTGYVTGVNICLSVLSLTTIVVAFLWGHRTGGLLTAVITAGICSVWYEFVYFAPKAFNEVVATHLFLPGVYLGVHGKWFQPRIRLFLAGCLCGCALGLRIQLLPAVAVALLYICWRKDWQERTITMMAGIIGPLLIFGLVDAFTWSYPFQSFWKHFWINIIEKRSHIYGVSPWYEYFVFMLKSWSFFIVPIALLAIIGSFQSPILAWLAIAVILIHSLPAHKEYRFIYTALPLILMLAGLGTSQIVKFWLLKWRSHQAKFVAVSLCLILWASTSAVLAGRFNLYTELSWQMLWNNRGWTHWNAESGNLQALQKLSQEKTVCGVGLWGIHWALSGGYTYLHQDVPMFLMENNKEFETQKQNFNYLVANIPIQQPGYSSQQCWGNTCIYQREGECQPVRSDRINQVIQQTGG
ncbi:mannosyltransferase [Tolypothrix sp. FACHB-123]|uniref:mannosyltransferase n=1 Tax=Tolypothrix sp. FACHB-123 TaxID=2692868 RepID=UPI001685E80B|nr:mannosyltransferase [Tolypothrix sp. FACHB-123]MBD2353222.1 mannosyltransferase [Tolypothrix sp. FACHB-123]